MRLMCQNRLPKHQLDATAARAKAGCRHAFEQLIGATLGVYYYLARWVPDTLRDDVVADSILHTYRVLQRYQPGNGWLQYMWKAVIRRQRQCYARISGPVTVASERPQVRRVTLPAKAMGVADFSTSSAPDYRDPLTALDDHQAMARLKRQLQLLPDRDRDAVLMEPQHWSAKYNVSRQHHHSVRRDVIAMLRRQMAE